MIVEWRDFCDSVPLTHQNAEPREGDEPHAGFGCESNDELAFGWLSSISLRPQESEYVLRDGIRLPENRHTRLLQDLRTRERSGFLGEVSVLDA